MTYNVQKLIDNPTGLKYIFFWGHTPSRDGSITKSCFSQWWLSPFIVDGLLFKTAEHWMMYKKAELFGDTEIAEKILNCETAAEAKKLGREVRGYVDKTWVENRYRIVKEGSLHKFSQNEMLKSYLLTTGDRVLVEASPVDSIWGIGIEANHTDADNPALWPGLNLLGFALMEIRDELR